MRTLDVEEALDLVEAEIERFYRRHDTDDFDLLSCGPDPQRVGRGGGPVGALMWHCDESKFQDCKKRIERLRRAVEKIGLVEGIDVVESLEGDGEVWRIEFAKERGPDLARESAKGP